MRPGGLDYLAVEVPIEPRDPELEIARYNAAACESDPNSIIGWESTFEGDTFQIVSLPDGRIRGILARSPEIRTAEGIGVGSSLAEVTDAYGSATMTEHAFTDTFTVSGADGILTIEVGSDRSDEYPAGEVLWMVATGSDSAGASFARTAYGPCV